MFKTMAEWIIVFSKDLSEDIGISFIQGSVKDKMTEKKYIDTLSDYLARQNSIMG